MSDNIKIYGNAFYKDRDASTRYAAQEILSIASSVLPPINNAADVGCGVGTWLSVLVEMGITHVRGFDGPWVDQNLLKIPIDAFTEADLKQPLQSQERFDLAVSLEVAEHLPPECADHFVESLTGLSDFVLFSAAIPFQGGVNHLNEQWQSYWAEKFATRGYAAVDPIRAKIWDDQQISIPYRQNVILYVLRERLQEVDATECRSASLSVAHPQMYELRNSKSIKQAIGDLSTTASAKIKRMVGHG